MVWRWDNTDPYGANLPNENPSGLGVFKNNNRFPGQYYDEETGTHYNGFRDYDPRTGYIQSDPIGLAGGLSTYAYVSGSPLMYSDFLGLYKDCVYWGTDYGQVYMESKTGDVSRKLLINLENPDIKYIDKGSKPKNKLPFGGMPIKPRLKVVGYSYWRLYLLTWTETQYERQNETVMYYCREVDGCSVGPWVLDVFEKTRTLKVTEKTKRETQTDSGYVSYSGNE